MRKKPDGYAMKGPAVAALLCCGALGCGDDSTGPQPLPLPELFGAELFQADGTLVGVQDLADKDVIGIYFASPTCSACAGFTPVLVDAFNQLQSDGKSFEVVLVSYYLSDSGLLDYMENSSMPWLAVSSESGPTAALVKRYNVQWIPTLIIIDGEGRTISKKGRDELVEDGTAAYDQWLAEAGS
jgi:hypothetical protein